MKKFTRFLALGLLLFQAATVCAADEGYPIGYCNGEMNRSATLKFSDKNTDISAAIYIPTGYASSVVDNEIRAIRDTPFLFRAEHGLRVRLHGPRL